MDDVETLGDDVETLGDDAETRSVDGRRRFSTGMIALDVLVAALLTGLVWFDYWGGSLPPSPGVAPLVLAVSGGLAVALALVYLDARRPLSARFRSAWGFLLVMAAAVAVGLYLFPSGLPVSMEVGLLVFVWTSSLVRAAVARLGSPVSDSAPGGGDR